MARPGDAGGARVAHGRAWRWTLADQNTADAARKRLESVSPLAEKVAGAPLDAELLGVYLASRST